jgi:hypothetical protein
MVNIPLGQGAYKRVFAGEPEVVLENRYLEKNITNLREGSALLSRCGTTLLNTFGAGKIRRTFSRPGFMGSDLFVVSGPDLYRWDGTHKTHIGGIINGTGVPQIGWMKGIGYEYLFITDGLLLQWYGGGTHATATLKWDAAHAITTQVIKIGTTYYAWNTDVSSALADGTSAHPFLALLTNDPLGSMANMLNFAGTAGIDYSPTLGGPRTDLTATANEATVATGTLTVTTPITSQVIEIDGYYYTWGAIATADQAGTSANPYIAALGDNDAMALTNMAKLINYNGTAGITYNTTYVTAAAADVSALYTATTLDITALSGGAAGNEITTTVYSGTGVAWGGTTLSGGSAAISRMILTAISNYTDANSIATTIVSGSYLTWSAATMTGGGTHALSGVTMPDGKGAKALSSSAGYVLVSAANSQQFFWLKPGAIEIDPLDYAEKESHPDNIVDMMEVGDQVLISGGGSTENWYATGNDDAPWLPVQGRVYQRGVVAGTMCAVSDSVIFVGDDGVVYSVGYGYGESAQWGVHRISDHGIEERIRIQRRREAGLST